MYDRAKVERSHFECRLCRQEVRIGECLERLKIVEESICELSKQEARLSELSGKVESAEGKVTELCKEEGGIAECLDRVKVVEATVADLRNQLNVTESRMGEVEVTLNCKVEVDGMESVLSRIGDCEKAQTELTVSMTDLSSKVAPYLDGEWPTVIMASPKTKRQNSGFAAALKKKRNETRPVSENTVRFCDKYKDKGKETVVLIGDSMLRGVGCRLERNSNMFSSSVVGGERIERTTKRLREVSTSEDSHVVVMVGTNNLKTDNVSEFEKKYREMLDTLKNLRCRKRSVVGIFRRARNGDYMNSKRLGVNESLRKLCAEFECEYIDPEEIYKSADESKFKFITTTYPELEMLDRWGLHLNYWGQDEVAAYLFKHCVSFLG